MKLAAMPVLSVMTAGAFPKVHFQALLDQIERIELVRHGLGKVFLVHSNDGKKYKFGVTKLEDWKREFEEHGLSIE